MAKTRLVWGHTQRPWGFEVRVDFDGDDGVIHNEVLTFREKPPDETALAVAVEAARVALTTRLATHTDDVVVDPRDVEIAVLTARVKTLEAEVASLTADVVRR